MKTPQATPQEYVADSYLSRRYDVSRATIWRWAKDGRIPKPVKLTPGCSRWKLADVVASLEG